MSVHVIAYDIGTTGIKTCIFEISDKITLVGAATQGYGLQVYDNGGAEQNPEDWWEAMCTTTARVLQDKNIGAEQIQGISFCSQMQGLVLVDQKGNALRPSMNYMDQRAGEEYLQGIGHGIRIAGLNGKKLIRSLMISGAVAASVKDPVWKYKWVEKHEPEIYGRIYKWLDVKEYLIGRCTDRYVMTRDSAFATLLYDTRKGREGFSSQICKMFGVNLKHLPQIIASEELVGGLTAAAAKMLSLKEGTPVFGGGGDASLIGVGAGAVEVGDTHIYSGTSGWVSTVVEKQTVDLSSMIAAIVGADQGKFNYFAELETAGKCLEWVKDHLALDEIDIYLEKKHIADSREAVYTSLYDYMMHVIKEVPAGSNGVIFTPWLHGNRCPFEDSNARGMFFNISIDTGKTEMIHAVLEGICYHLRWQLEASEKKINASQAIRFVGGGALAPLTCQLMADIFGREIETVDNPQNVGAVGAALIAAVGLGLASSLTEAKALVKVEQTYRPDPQRHEVYQEYFSVFKNLYKCNKASFKRLNGVDKKKTLV